MPAGRRARRRRPWALWAAAPRPPAAPGWPRQRPSLGQPCRLGWWSTFSYSSRRSILPPVALLVFLAAAAPAGIVAPQLGSGGPRRRRTPTVGARRQRRRLLASGDRQALPSLRRLRQARSQRWAVTERRRPAGREAPRGPSCPGAVTRNAG